MTNLDFRELEETPNWFEQAECRGMDTDLFFPEKGGTAEFAIARRVCDECPVAIQCLQFAVKNGEHHGVWGGTNSKQRRPRQFPKALEMLKIRQSLARGEITEVEFKRIKRGKVL